MRVGDKGERGRFRCGIRAITSVSPPNPEIKNAKMCTSVREGGKWGGDRFPFGFSLITPASPVDPHLLPKVHEAVVEPARAVVAERVPPQQLRIGFVLGWNGMGWAGSATSTRGQ